MAIGSPSKTKLQEFWIGHLGIEKVGEFKSEKENVDEDILRVGSGVLGSAEIDLMAPIDDN